MKKNLILLTLLMLAALGGILAATYNVGAATDLYVDCANGVDQGPTLANFFTPACTNSSAPCRDPQFALGQLPKLIQRQTTVHIGWTGGGAQQCFGDNAVDAGAAAVVDLTNFVVDPSADPTGRLTLIGAETVLAGPYTVTASSAPNSIDFTATVAGTPWTSNQWVGDYVELLSGTGFVPETGLVPQNRNVVTANASNTITFAAGFNDLGIGVGTTFRIVAPATQIVGKTAIASTTDASGLRAFRITNSGAAWNSRMSEYGAAGQIQIIGLQLVGLSALRDSNDVYFYDTTFDHTTYAPGGSSNETLSVSNASQTIYDSKFTGVSTAIAYARGGNATTTVWDSVLTSANGYGVADTGTGTIASNMTSLNFTHLGSTNSKGVVLYGPSSSLVASTFILDSAPSDGMEIGAGAFVNLITASGNAGTGGYGMKITNGGRVMVSADTSMTGSLGDVNLDGNVKSYVTVRAAPEKSIMDANTGSVVASQ